MKFKLIIIFVLCTSAISIHLYAQSDSEKEFAFLNSEITLFLNYEKNPAEFAPLLDSLKIYSAKGEYDIAVVFAEILLDELNHNSSDHNRPQDTASRIPRFQMDISVGADLNRQEFEIDYLEKDSLLIDELEKPYVALNSKFLIFGDFENGLSNKFEFRFDKQNIRSSMEMKGNFDGSKSSGYGKLGFIYDKDKLYPELSFSELNAGFMVHTDYSASMLLQIENITRYKNYHKKNENLPDFVFDQLRLLAGTRNAKRLDFYVSYNLLLNESLNNKNNDYLEHEGIIDFNYDFLSAASIEPAAGFRFRKYSYVLQDSVVENSTSSPFVQFNPTIRFPMGITWLTEYQWMYKSYLFKSEDDPDYFLNELNTTFRKTVYAGISLELGYTFEQKMHLYFPSAIKAYIDEQNYTGNGIIAGFDYLNSSNTFVSLSGSYVWRRYPYASGADNFGIYSNRNIFSIFFNLQLPVTEQLELNLLMVYDNDKDLDSDNNNYNSTIFTSEIRYRF